MAAHEGIEPVRIHAPVEEGAVGERHELLVEADDGDAVVFLCREDGCGRRVVVDRPRRSYTVIDRGDFFALHSGAVGPIGVRAEVA